MVLPFCARAACETNVSNSAKSPASFFEIVMLKRSAFGLKILKCAVTTQFIAADPEEFGLAKRPGNQQPVCCLIQVYKYQVQIRPGRLLQPLKQVGFGTQVFINDFFSAL